MSIPSVVQTLVLPRQGFGDPNAAMDRLFDLFPDKYPALVAESATDWTFELGWPRHILEPIDPKLSEQARACFGLELSELENYVELRSHAHVPFVFSMFHSHALLAPAFAAQMNGRLPEIVVHVDAHHDLSPTLLGPSCPGMLVNQAFNIECRLDGPDTITRTIGAGFLNKASFLTAYMLASGAKRVLHIDPRCVPGTFVLNAAIQPINLCNGLMSKHAFIIERAVPNSVGELVELPELPDTLQMSGGDQVWLDVDLDAFCNRFDGDSDNHHQQGSGDEKSLTVRRAEEFLRKLAQADWSKQIAAVSIAASPGFFPSEYWEPVVPVVCDGIMNLL